MNYFQLYNIPVSFTPNKALVRQQYFALNKKYHPDFVSNGTDSEKADALELSSTVNKAYKILCNADDTIKYVLQLNGFLENEEKYDLPKTFLMEMMELNEQLMDATMDDDDLKIASCKQAIDNLQLTMYNLVKDIILAETTDNISKDDFLKVKDYYFKKKYLNRILDGIK